MEEILYISEKRTNNKLSPITRREIDFALKGMPVRKAPGADELSTEIVVAVGEAGHTHQFTKQYGQGRLFSKANQYSKLC